MADAIAAEVPIASASGTSASVEASRSAICSSSVANEKSGVSTPERSVSDLCNASNIWLMFRNSRNYRGTQLALTGRWLLQCSVQFQQSLRGLLNLIRLHLVRTF